jgi:uncharacterized circularly permuted ATP-grasp superfamily protein
MTQSAFLPSAAEIPARPASLFDGYTFLGDTYDEMLASDGVPRPAFHRALEVLARKSPDEVRRCQALVDRALLSRGVTFSVYSDNRGTEKIFPFDVLPRMVSARDWSHIRAGLEQRVRALELFLDDVYADGRIFAKNRIPAEVVLASRGYLKEVRGVRPPGGVRIHVAGIDLIRDADGTWRVLEDNLRTPSGVSYLLENRVMARRAFPAAFDRARVHPVDVYSARLGDALRSISLETEAPNVVLLTPGPYNSAFFEHAFLARTMGIDLVQASDLFVDDDRVWLRTTRGPAPVHVIYRRIDDAFLDPEVFRPDSMLGVRGLFRAWQKGKVALANAPGNGIADDKAVYPYVPEMIRFYLYEEPILEQVPTYLCARDDDCAFVIEHLNELVVKAVDEAGGYGMLMGPQSTAELRDEFRRRILADPRRYVAQRRIELSSCPTWDGDLGCLVPRRVDLRPYIVSSNTGPWVLPGGLTRVALVEGSYVVNSSQGGGSKDTWVLKP